MAIKPHYCIYGKLVIPQRYVLCFMIFLAVLISYTMRVCLHIAIVEIAVPLRHMQGNLTDPCPDLKESTVDVKGGTYNWTAEQQGHILGAFFPGYVITHLPGGFLADVIGAKHILGGGLALSAVFTFLTPVVIKNSEWWGVYIIRFFIGFAQGPIYPCLSTFLSKWVPLRERTALGAFVNTGNQLGSIIGNLGSSQIMAHINWPMVFYFWAILAAIWYIFFMLTCYSEPTTHPFVTEGEAQMLHEAIGPKQKFKVPWLSIVKDPAVWGLLGGQIGHDVIFFLIVVQLPTYMKNVLKFNIKENGVLNSIPYLCLWLSSLVTGVLADYLISKDKISILRIRQIYTFVGNVGPGICVVIASYLGCNRIASASMFIIGMLIMGPFYSGMKVNVLDITKNFAGIIMAIVNGLGALAYFPVPSVTSMVTKNNTLEEWRIVFWVLLLICTAVSSAYVLLTSGERAEWDKVENQESE
ncbi:hypothetical protein ILUMI_10000 [Ignelater luminosus]|uniref:Major facilitator superfamily (MFS) profile domain-containing protein n=1 Tax=Ignelater luminosus TaxID=2038154 RepID=A0A8K0D374_IGNLU|nr:hypothetical protein ILUMI_10000 [Ignelater luminosus]